MESAKKVLANFLKQPDIWFFYGLLLTFTLSVRKVLFFYSIRGQFNEYMGIHLYFSDVFILLMGMSVGMSILYNKLTLKSIFKINFKPYLKQKIAILSLLLIILSFLSISWSSNRHLALFRSIKLLEFYFLYLWVIFRLFHMHNNVPRLPCSDKLFHPSQNVPRGTFDGTGVEQFVCYQGGTILKNLALIIIGTGIIQSVIGIWQFFIQKSIGLFWLKESLISLDISGVAKIALNGDKYIRAYGLFPHPNILGGFLLISIVLTILYFKLFHPSTNVPPQYKCSTPVQMFHPSTNVPRGTFCGAGVEHFAGQAWNILRGRRRTICLLSGWNILYYAVLGTQIVALILTFSKSAWIGLIISLIYLYYVNISSRCKCFTCATMFHVEQFTRRAWNILRGRRGTEADKKMFHPSTNVPRGTFCGAGVEHFKVFALIAGIIILLIVIIKPDWYSIVGKSLEDRAVYLNVSRGTFLESPILGVGAGNFVNNMSKNYPNLEIWQYQPVHNVFLLILNELGIIGLILFCWFIWEIIKDKVFRSDTNVPPRYKCSTPVQMFHPSTNVPRGTFYGADVEQQWAKNCSTWNNFSVIGRKHYYKAIFIGFLFIMLVDHYFWDIQQGQIIFWLILGILAGGKVWTGNKFNTYPQDES